MPKRTTTLSDIAALLQQTCEEVGRVRDSYRQIRDAVNATLATVEGIEAKLDRMKDEVAVVMRDAVRPR